MATQAQLEPEALESEFHQWLAGQNYLMVMPAKEGRWAALHPFAFTWAIIEGKDGDRCGYSDRWCYATFDKAVDGLNEWLLREFEGEPSGWHRHPSTGRRRPDGDASQEYLNP